MLRSFVRSKDLPDLKIILIALATFLYFKQHNFEMDLSTGEGLARFRKIPLKRPVFRLASKLKDGVGNFRLQKPSFDTIRA